MIAEICSRSYYLTIKSGFLMGISSRAARVFLVIEVLSGTFKSFLSPISKWLLLYHFYTYSEISKHLRYFDGNLLLARIRHFVKMPNKSDCVKVWTNTMHVSPVLENNSEWKGFDNMATNNILVNKLSCLVFPLF